MKEEFLTHDSSPLPALFAKNLYERMLLTRLVNKYICQLHAEESTPSYDSCQGYEAAQIGSAICIEVGQDFTLPCTQDLGVVLTIGMTPYEVFRTFLDRGTIGNTSQQAHWSYHKHNTVTGAAPVATQILHAAGIAFASKLRRANAVTIAYCNDDVVTEPDFLEGMRFSSQHKLPILFICEHGCQDGLTTTTSCINKEQLPENLIHHMMSGVDVTQIYRTMQQAMQTTRAGRGPVLLEIFVTHLSTSQTQDPLLHHKQYLQTQGIWDETWATQLQARLQGEVGQAMQDVLSDTQNTKEREQGFSSHVS